jgi:hypothetical protein
MAHIFKKPTARAGFLLSFVAATALYGGVASATALVVRSSGPSATSYKPGKALPDNAKVALRPGDMLTVLATDSTRTFRGPGTFALAGGGGANPAALAGRRGRFSALRTAGIIPRSPTLWHIDVAQNGRMCLADRNNVMLWRANATRAAMLTINQAGSKQNTQWAAGQATLAWPSGVPIVPGAEYQLSLADGAPTRMTFVTLPNVPTDLTSVARALIEQKCDNQLELLIQTVPEADPSGS